MNVILFGTFLIVCVVLLLTAMVMVARGVLMPSQPAVLTVNGATDFDVRTGQKLLTALHDHDVLVPSACAGAGTCGLCRVTVLDEDQSYLPVEVAHLSNADRRQGVHLACQVTLRDDMAVEAPQEWVGATSYTCTVHSVTALTPLIREIVLQLPDHVDAAIVAGSYVQVTAPPYTLNYSAIDTPEEHSAAWHALRSLSVESTEEVTRAYSISNRPEDTAARRVVLNIRLALPPPSEPDVPPGIVSSWLFDLKPGKTVTTSGPFGTFRAQPTDKEMVFIGGGVGMAPLRALIHEQLGITKSGRKMTFWYGARSKAELLYVDELNALADAHETFEWTVALSDPQPEDNWQGAIGFVHQVALERYLRDHPAPEECEYYLCGPPLMIRAVFQMLDDLGVDRDHIFNDDFGV
jgi:Na+-transporting NADH:ubiquinone oxidoreductase subunit F